MKYPKVPSGQPQQKSYNTQSPADASRRSRTKPTAVPSTPGGSQSGQSGLNTQHPGGLYKGKVNHGRGK